ncbi:SLC13 family permease [Idiomarina loihiensis]|jgi:di/tricarboxylate transporter|uniref:Na+/anion symporter n=1 Tax=Idiomarina loihiensis (strain ATCC BAA-735 / DSM 15497 / L2-TR) TaxID=283942 RepID=Q5QWF0_IDILO|nr:MULTISPECIES: SLC13 family permease [Idiomarina]AAV83337.1 Na+/anion symporter [Idiomarina loihiensis L2TR]AGM37380.1 Na+/anion symporter [Idiomarina loihiensis GSL 199]MRJ45785.1 SLC13 family permease [Idiomarina loihiensis]UTW32774.1 SLC13 family permease [Idiomarina loihiensis]|tara:strand:+ start:5701 stop:7476 length:1776 start_codon:yes stop_codon:yes gene_type:complete
MLDQWLIGIILVAMLVLFVIDKWRYDLVAMMALLSAAILGLVPTAEVFSGFGNAAVITVAAVLIISQALWRSGVVDALASAMKNIGDKRWLQMIALTSVTTICSAFISNTGTMAIMIPVALQLARSSGNNPSKVLMPMAFGSLLGGTITMVGTPPNIIIADIRREAMGESFGIFEFTPVGLSIAIAGLLFMWLLSHWLVPEKAGKSKSQSLYDVSSYLTELYVPEGSNFVGETLYELENRSEEDFVIVALQRGEKRWSAPARYLRLKPEDVLIVEANAETIQQVIDGTGLELNAEEEIDERFLKSDDITVIEGIVGHDSRLIGRSAGDIKLRSRYGINVLGVAREGQKLGTKLANIRFKPGDVLLLQGDAEVLNDVFQRFGCFPLAQRSLRLGSPKQLIQPLGIFSAAILAAALGFISVPVAFSLAAGLMVITNILPLRELYDAIDWPIIVLLGATIPLGSALERSGAADTIANAVLYVSQGSPDFVAVGLLLIVTMLLSNIVNNAAAAVLMAPIGISMASSFGASMDPFLMAVAIGAAVPFLTPIGHQSNILVMGPGGYNFSDYWRLGLPLSLLVSAVALVMILLVWPLY